MGAKRIAPHDEALVGARRDLNPQPPHPQCGALPIELRAPCCRNSIMIMSVVPNLIGRLRKDGDLNGNRRRGVQEVSINSLRRRP
jgi:hypothetical protein